MGPRVKICCIQSEEEAELAVRFGASCIGLVGEMPSGPGPITDRAIRTIARSVPPGVATFLLTSRTDAMGIVDHVRTCETSVVQIVDENVERGVYDRLRAECPSIKIVQVVHVEDDSAIHRAMALQSRVDAVLLDSGRPSASTPELGGTGRTHDWTVSASIVSSVSVPVFLAGGLNALNVAEALHAVRPFGVDLCSGVRTNGSLDEEKLREFMRRTVAWRRDGHHS
ncbi:MAG: phosphoribosylanthranilate isomerase [Gemmatimonadetes bacterium]|nr:phosphoribosylanthranilate isomerase [Gemmatimonadota bacterium]